MTINDRISECIKATGLTKTAFAERINLSQPHISKIASGSSTPSDRTIADICREFNVSETWLRTGEGNMFVPLNRDVQLAEFFGDVLHGETPDFRRRFLSALSKLEPDEWVLLEKIITTMTEEIKMEKPRIFDADSCLLCPSWGRTNGCCWKK